MQRVNEIKSIMRQLKESHLKNESSTQRAINESMRDSVNEEIDTENDASETDVILARLEDILSRFEKVLSAETEEPAEEEETTEEEVVEEEPAEDEEAAEESYTRQLERRIADLERRFTESRRMKFCSRFKRC